MDNEKLTRFLQRPLIATISTTNPDGSPQASFVWYEWNGEVFRVSCLVYRRKVINLRRDQRCLIAIIDPDDSNRWVIASGRAEIDEQGGRELIEALNVKYGGDGAALPEPRVVIRLRPDKIRTSNM